MKNEDNSEINEIKDLMEKMIYVRPDAIGFINSMKEQLKIFENSEIKQKSYLKAFKKELIIVAKNVFSRDEFNSLNDNLIIKIDIPFVLKKIKKRGCVLDDVEFESAMECIDEIIQNSKNLSKKDKDMIADVNVILALYK